MNTNKAESFFTSYEAVLASAYEKVHIETEKNLSRGVGTTEEDLRKACAEAAARWETQPFDELEGMTPGQYLDTVEGGDELLEMFKLAPIICDAELPDIYLNKLKACGEAAVDALLGFAADQAAMDDEEELFLIPLMALRILGDWKVEKAIDPMIRLLDREGVNYESFAEQIKASLAAIGAPASESVMAALGSRESGSAAFEYLLMALAEIGNPRKSEVIYRCLKNAFQSMDNKVIGALCLKSYGDGRAVPALRGYLEKNRGKVDQEVFYEVISVIRSLGGSIEGMQ